MEEKSLKVNSVPVPPSTPYPPSLVNNEPLVISPSASLADEVSSFNRRVLKNVTTVVHRMPVVPSRQEHNITGAPTAEEVIEYHDPPEQVEANAKAFAQLIRDSKHFVCYTGAGVSTAAKIPDYRGPKGVWTLQTQGKAPKMEITLEQALPTYTHMALVKLAKEGLLKFLVSTNVDGLHRRSGIPEDRMSELHGNIYREVCSVCEAEYLRPFDTRKNVRNRFTGRLCEKPECRGRLVDSIINFGENLPRRALKLATKHSQAADLTLVLGSSMRVKPACDLPSYSYKMNNGKFCVCNLQKTPFDHAIAPSGGIRVFSECDQFMKIVMEELQLDVEDFNPDKYEDLDSMRASIVVDPDFEAHPYRNAGFMADGDGLNPQVLAQILAGVSLRHIEVERK